MAPTEGAALPTRTLERRSSNVEYLRKVATRMGRVRVAAVLAAYNRRDLTLTCLRSLRAQSVPDLVLDTYVLDDASVDGTGKAIARRFPDVKVLQGNGTYYWNGGMRAAFAAAMQEDYDYYLWLNDDVQLDGNAVRILLETERELTERTSGPVLVSGATRDPVTGEVTYGGVVHPHRWRPLRSVLVQPGDQPLPCDTMHGNVVLVPREVTRRIGNIDPAFVQLMGDFDYGLRARAAGCSVWLARGTVGTCSQNPPHDESVPLLKAWRQLWSTKELALGPWATYTRRWAGPLWPVYWFSPYARRGSRAVVARLTHLTQRSASGSH
jgi:GT2 family glycosyltransferase